jgi:hypothetical protein
MKYRTLFFSIFLLLSLQAMDNDSKKLALEKELALLKKEEVEDLFATIFNCGATAISAIGGYKSLTIAAAIPCTYFMLKASKKNDKKEKLALAIEQLKSIQSNQEKK